MSEDLARLWEKVEAAFRNLEIAESRGLNQTALDRLYRTYLDAYAAYEAARAKEVAPAQSQR